MTKTAPDNTETKPVLPPQANRRRATVRACRRALYWTIGILGAYIGYQYNSFTIFAYLPPGGDILLPIGLTFLILATPLYILYIALRYFKASYAQAFYPLLIFSAAYFLFNPMHSFNSNMLSACSRFQQQREQLVYRFCAGEINLQLVHPNIYIPPDSLRYKAGLSHNVFIDCQEDRNIASFTIWGYLDGSEEFMYRSDDSLPEPTSQSGIRRFKKVKPNWYYVVY